MINLALEKLRPNAKWQMTNNNYDELVWLDEEQTKPTKKEVDDEIAKIEDLNRIQQIEAKCNQSIEAIYPIYKQINITNLLTPYTEQDRDTMKVFIDNKRAICHQAIANGTKAEDVDFSNES